MAEEQQESSQGEMEGERTSYKTKYQINNAGIAHESEVHSCMSVLSVLFPPW